MKGSGNSNILLSTVLSVLLLWTFAALPGCAGSTRGTGGVTVAGKVINLEGDALANVIVSVLESGESTTTNSNGDFSLQSGVNNPENGLSLLFESATLNATTELNNIPAGTDRVAGVFRADEDKDEVEAEEIRVEEDDDDDDDSGNSSSGSGGQDSDDDDDDSENSGSDSDDDDSSESDSDIDDDDDSSSSGSGSGSDDSDDVSSDDSDDDSSDDSSDDSDDDDSSGGSDDDSCDDVDAEGVIQVISGSSISVADTTYQINATTEFRNEDESPASQSDFNIGDNVKVKGECEAGNLVAERIEFD